MWLVASLQMDRFLAVAARVPPGKTLFAETAGTSGVQPVSHKRFVRSDALRSLLQGPLDDGGGHHGHHPQEGVRTADFGVIRNRTEPSWGVFREGAFFVELCDVPRLSETIARSTAADNGYPLTQAGILVLLY